MKSFAGRPWIFIASLLWLAFSLALAAWWMIFALNQADKLSTLLNTQDLQRTHRMLLSEGAFLIFLLLAGGAALIYYSWRETERSRRMREFFAAFTHDVKTSLASMRLQAESLAEDLAGSSSVGLVGRLLSDANRLELQLENSLLISATELKGELLKEKVQLSDIFDNLRRDWPDVKIQIEGPTAIKLRGDSRALNSIFRNLTHNAIRHGGATELAIRVTQGDRVQIEFRDNGRGFQGNPEKIGERFWRHTTASGSGLGLYLVQSLTRQMGGGVKYTTSPHFVVRLELQGEK